VAAASAQNHPQKQYQHQKAEQQDISSISMSLINSIWFNQVTLLLLATSVALSISFLNDHRFDISTLHWNDMESFHSLFDWNPTALRIAEGVLAAFPMVAMGCMVENSENTDASQVNFSTTNMVISLFGRRKSRLEPAASAPSQVMMLCAAIALSTGISEEVIFRGYIPSAITTLTHSVPLALVGQAILFACGHLSKNARPGENRLVGSLQLFNGLFQGMLYLVTGGDILPCIISHVLYDCHILCETWMTINNQMDYTQESSQRTLAAEEEKAVKKLQNEAGALLSVDTINFARRFFYAFDSEHNGSLSQRDMQRAVTYAFMNDKTVPDPQLVKDLFQQVQDSKRFSPTHLSPPDRISFSQFLQVLLVLRSNAATK
jgi:membrane protease YdiL (CAAX protease family)